MDDKLSFTLQQEITDLQVALERKRSEIGNLVTGYRRAVEGIGPIPPEPLRRNLVEARAELTVLESRLIELRSQAEASQDGVSTA